MVRCGVAFVSDQDLVLDAIEDQRILAEHIEPTLFLLDRREVAAAMKRLRAGYGLRVVK